MQRRHYLSNIDPVARTAMCSICGPTRVKRRPPWPPGGEPRYRCNTSYAATPSTIRRLTAEEESHRKRLSKYGLTAAEFEALVAMQDGRCAICKRELALDIDHDHDTNEVRGLLCRSCNRGIRLLGDTAEGIRAALDYLLAPPSRELSNEPLSAVSPYK
jgi:hypothetical protein